LPSAGVLRRTTKCRSTEKDFLNAGVLRRIAKCRSTEELLMGGLGIVLAFSLQLAQNYATDFLTHTVVYFILHA
jgi:hypothetical protein